MTFRVDRGRPIVRRKLLAGVAALLVPLPALAQTATKEKVAAALPKLREFARQIVGKQLMPGLAIAIVYRDEIALLDAKKVLAIPSGTPVGKTFDSTAIPSSSPGITCTSGSTKGPIGGELRTAWQGERGYG